MNPGRVLWVFPLMLPSRVESVASPGLRFRWRGAWLGLLGGLLSAEVSARVETRVDLALSRGGGIEARVQVPRGDDPDHGWPAVMLFGGFERGESVLDLVASARPKVLASFDYPLAIPEDLRGWEAVRHLPAARHGIHDTLEGIGGLYAHLRGMPEVDPERITIVGVSLGAPFAVISAARHDIPGLAVIHGFGSVDEVIAHQFGRRWSRSRGEWVWAPARWLGRWLAWYAAVPEVDDYATRLASGQQAWMLSAREDERIPAAATQALRQAFERSQAGFSFELEEGGHLRGEDDPRIPRLLSDVERWMVERGLH